MSDEQPGEDVWTADRVRSFGVRIPSKLAIKAVYGCGEVKAYELLSSGEDLGFRVFRLGKRYVTPTADVLRLLGLNEQENEAA